jgi:hypothetical protein
MKWVLGRRCQVCASRQIDQSCVYATVFSGKLSLVMTHSEEANWVGSEAVAVPESVPGPREVGGREGPEPTRFGDWELRGRCIDF